MTRLKNRDGFALPMSILIIAVLTAAVAASFSSATAEYRVNEADRGVTRAYRLAETGLESFLINRSTSGFCQHCGDPIQVDSEWTTVSLNGGYAQVTAIKVRPAIDSNTPAIYFIRSRGVDTLVKLSGGGSSTYAEHTVGIYAKWDRTTMKVTAAWVSLSGIVMNGNAGTIDGSDACGQMPTVAGGQVPTGGFSGETSPFNGSPPIDSSKTLDSLKKVSPIDWNSIINNNSMPADFTIPQQSFPGANYFADSTVWPVIRIHTNGYSLPNAGRGIIIADSDFTISGSNMWSGIVLVGGKLTSNGNNTTWGATISGLNYLINGQADPGTVDDATLNGQKSYVYDSCSVAKASLALRHYVTLSNSWSDNLASY
jgi:type II secretory pathway pseudopilin PulG